MERVMFREDVDRQLAMWSRMIGGEYRIEKRFYPLWGAFPRLLEICPWLNER